MAKITLHSDNQISATSVSNTFIDEYMSDANGEFVKIYLYLLRLMNAPEASFSISSIADKFGHMEKDIRRALAYWERMNLLQLEYDGDKNLTGIRLLDSVPRQSGGTAVTGGGQDASVPREGQTVKTAQTSSAGGQAIAPASPAGTPEAAPDVCADTVPAKKNYSPDDVLRFREDEAFADLLFVTERYLGRTLTATDINTISYLYDKDGLGFSTELIEYLIESCVSSNHASIRYIEKVALGWAKQHITTVEEAKQGSPVLGKTYYKVMSCFGLSGQRMLVPSETAFISRWINEYGFSDDIIAEACNRTMQRLHQPSFEYADKLLANWRDARVHHLSDIIKLDSAHQNQKKNAAVAATAASPNRFNNFKQRDYDFDQLEKMLLTTNAH